MDQATFDTFVHLAVNEPVHATEHLRSKLLSHEAVLDRHLRSLKNGRLEQEFLAAEAVQSAVQAWAAT